MKYSLTFELPGLPKGMNGSHGHWKVAYKRRKMWRSASYGAAVGKRPKTPLERCRIICTRFSSIESDYDNLVASFKPIIDGLIDAKIIVNDSSEFVKERSYLWVKAKPKGGKVKVQVEEIDG